MKPPKAIVVGPFVYDIVIGRAEMNQKCRDEQTDLLGHCEPRDAVIHIEPKQAVCQKRDSVLHEALHAIADVTGLGNEWSGDTEESIIRRLSPAILSLLRDNPKLVAFLVAP